jgi:hypothetical protein
MMHRLISFSMVISIQFISQDKPEILTVFPKSSPSSGGGIITVLGTGMLGDQFSQVNKVYCKFGEISCDSVRFLF